MRAVIEIIDPLAKGQTKEGKKAITDEELNDKVDEFLADPSDGAAALGLESTIEQGACNQPNKSTAGSWRLNRIILSHCTYLAQLRARSRSMS